MFYDNLSKMCAVKGVRITPLLISLNISTGNINKWRGGAVPNGDTLAKLSSALGCTVGHLLGTEKIKAYDEQDNPIILDRETIEILEQLRENPETRVLFSVAKTVTKEDFEQVVKIIKALKEPDKKERD